MVQASNIPNMGLGAPSSPDEDDRWEKAKVIFREKVETEEGGKLKTKSLESLNEAVTPRQAIAQCEKTKDRAEKEYSSKKEVVVPGKKLNIKEKMAKILRKMNMFLGIEDVIFEHSPETAAVVWSAIRLILEVALDDINTCGLLIDAVDEITGAMFAAEIYERRYHKAEVESEKETNNSEITYGSKTRLLKGITKPIMTLQGILDGITKKLGDMHSVAGLVFQEQSLEAFEEIFVATKTQGEETRTFIKDVMFKSNRDKGACGWLFEETEFNNWYSSEESEFLWVYGNVGFGKSVLMSAIIDRILDDIKKNAAKDPAQVPLVAFFFCKFGNEKTQKTLSVVKNLVYQYYRQCRYSESQDNLAEANQKVKELINENTGIISALSSSTETLQDGLNKLMIGITKLINHNSYIIVDALDECDDREKEGLLAFLQKAARKGSKIKVIVSSRQEPDISKMFSDQPKISVEEQKNTSDLKVYVKKELQKITILRDKERAGARKVIVKRAAGMFRYAALALQNLKQPWARPLSKHLKNLPDQITEFYKRSLDSMDSQQKEVLFTALRWAICSFEDITVQQIAEDFSCVFLSAEQEVADQLPIDELDEDEGNNSSGDIYSDDDGDSDSGSDSDATVFSKPDAEHQVFNQGSSNLAGGSLPPNQQPQYTEASHLSRLAQPIEHVKNSRGIFFSVGEDNVVRLTHNSVKDFIQDSAKIAFEGSTQKTPCPKCLKDLEMASTVRCDQKWGHLLIALAIVRHLNSPEFQQRYMSWDPLWNEEETNKELQVEEIKNSIETHIEPQEIHSTVRVPAESSIGNAEQKLPEILNKNDTEASIIKDIEEEVATLSGNATEEAEKNSSTLKVPEDDRDHGDGTLPNEANAPNTAYASSEADSDYLAPRTYHVPQNEQIIPELNIRYEIRHFLKHINMAENLWTTEEKEVSKEWRDLIEGVKKVFQNQKVVHFWQRHVWSTNWDKWTPETGYGDPLSCFAFNELPTLVKAFLKDGADPNIIFPGGWKFHRSSLQFAVEGECPEIAEMLIEAGANLNWTNSKGKTTIDFACNAKAIFYNGLKVYLEHGGDATLADREGQQTTSLHCAALRADIKATKRLLKHGARINAKDYMGETPLHWAFSSREVLTKELVALLLENGAEVNLLDDDEQSPLYEAAWLGDLELLDLLIKHGADLHARDFDYLIFKGASVNIQDRHGASPLRRAIDGFWLLESANPSPSRERTFASFIRANPERYRTDYSIFALMAMLKSEIVFDALVDVGVDFSVVDEFGWSWAIYALQHGLNSSHMKSKGVFVPEMLLKESDMEMVCAESMPSKFVSEQESPCLSKLDSNFYMLGEDRASVEQNRKLSQVAFATDKPMPWRKSLYYYEVGVTKYELTEDCEDIHVGIGLGRDNPPLNLPVGHEHEHTANMTLMTGTHGQAFKDTQLHGITWGLHYKNNISISDTLICGVVIRTFTEDIGEV
ncbi:hypothetical protein H072_1753 [Dactylellina haptotyla CBS 200.50]|uniref:Nephrocystin 3-like N-terminal domain-containing protein n=1 Tax=Dactylellina haptotyla (strain CBS 200.50) TaxID=1284197 RepID=S8AMU9_DACHA|nr:hypothetical protein H072_1753 [Dactylellina haptotyla CBS 200.50]